MQPVSEWRDIDGTSRRGPSTQDPANALFVTVGQYVVMFQWIEGLIEQSLLLLWCDTPRPNNLHRLAGMTNQQKVDALKKAFQSSPANARGRTRLDWTARFEQLTERLHTARHRRNELLHSQYLFEFLQIGQPVLRSNRRRAGGEERFEQEHLGAAAQAALLAELAMLGSDLSLAYSQLIHDAAAAEGSEGR